MRGGHPCRPPPHKCLTHARWPHTSTSSPPRRGPSTTMTHPRPRSVPPAPRPAACHRHRPYVPMTWPIDNDDPSPAPSHATCTMPCHMPPPPPLRATTIGLTAGHCPLRAATATAIAAPTCRRCHCRRRPYMPMTWPMTWPTTHPRPRCMPPTPRPAACRCRHPYMPPLSASLLAAALYMPPPLPPFTFGVTPPSQ